jgi:hypothetical protein
MKKIWFWLIGLIGLGVVIYMLSEGKFRDTDKMRYDWFPVDTTANIKEGTFY